MEYILRHALKNITMILCLFLALPAASCGQDSGSRELLSSYHTETFVPGDTFGEPRGTAVLSDVELVRYLLSSIPEANAMVERGMSALVTGETTDLGDDILRDIWLGTNSKDNFTREILYSVGETGVIYMFDPLSGQWVFIKAGEDIQPQTILAYVRLAEKLQNGFALFFLDEVLWVDDLVDAPNGYRILSQNKDWVPYTAGERTKCALFGLDGEDGLVLLEYSFRNFLAEVEIGFRRDGFLAEVSFTGEFIDEVIEIYTP